VNVPYGWNYVGILCTNFHFKGFRLGLTFNTEFCYKLLSLAARKEFESECLRVVAGILLSGLFFFVLVPPAIVLLDVEFPIIKVSYGPNDTI